MKNPSRGLYTCSPADVGGNSGLITWLNKARQEVLTKHRGVCPIKTLTNLDLSNQSLRDDGVKELFGFLTDFKVGLDKVMLYKNRIGNAMSSRSICCHLVRNNLLEFCSKLNN